MSGTNNEYPNKELLGEILIKRHIITGDQLEQALEVQKSEKGFLGEILVRLGHVDEKAIVVALIVQCNLPYIAIDKYEVDKNIVNMIPEEKARKNYIVPLDRVGDVLSVVMANPLDAGMKAELQRETNCQIASFIATKDEILRAIDHLYGG